MSDQYLSGTNRVPHARPIGIHPEVGGTPYKCPELKYRGQQPRRVVTLNEPETDPCYRASSSA